MGQRERTSDSAFDFDVFLSHSSNGPAEGFNSRIQSIKAMARGFRNFANDRTRILFFCGKLDLMPANTH
jgi:transposase